MNSAAQLDITVSIVTGSDMQMTLDCLESLFSELDSTITAEVYLVDNCSGTPIADVAAQRFPQIKILRNRCMQGFGKNHNQVLQVARGEFVLVLNDDVLLKPGFMRKLLTSARNNDDGGIFGPRIFNADGSLQRSAYKFPTPFRPVLDILLATKLFRSDSLVGDYRDWDHRDSRNVEFLIGAALLVRKKLLGQIGLFDEHFYMYAEDTDLCFRCHQAGWKVLFVPDAEMIHYGGQSTLHISEEREAEFIRSHQIFIEKHFGATGLSTFRITILLKHALLLLRSNLSAKYSYEKPLHLDRIAWALGRLNRAGLRELAKAKENNIHAD